MAKALIGYTGFVGSNLCLDMEFDYLYNSKNVEEMIGCEYDLIICAGISAKKWYASLNPEADLAEINRLLTILKTVKAGKFILISTIDIYPDVNAEMDEDYMPDMNTPNHAYGKNRLWAEKIVREIFDYCVIVRLPALFGFGLRKNIIYDYIHDLLPNGVPNSSFQWYCVGDLKNDLDYILNQGITVVNLFTEPIENKDIFEICNNGPVIQYNMLTRYNITGYCSPKEVILAKLHRYIDIMRNNRLLISNLSWTHNDDAFMLCKLADYGIRQLEVAPTKYFSNGGEMNESVYSFQALLYPMTENIFGTDQERELLFDRLCSLIDKGPKVLVFGSPKNRVRGDKPIDIAIGFFKRVGDYAYSKNVVVCIEPNAKIYGCDFVTNSIEGRQFVLQVASPGFGLHLDVGCMLAEGEDVWGAIVRNLDILAHIHFSAPYLKSLIEINYNYSELLQKITQVYTKKVVIEMLNQSDNQVLQVVRKCLCLA